MAVTLGPALYTGRQPLLPFLKPGEQGVVQGRSKLSGALVVLQLAFSVLLLTSAGLAYRSVSFADGFNLGFDSGNILLATVNTAGSSHDPAGDSTLLEILRARLQRLPGVQAISYVRGVRTSSWPTFPVRAERSVAPVLAAQNFVGAGYFETVRVTFPAGHDFATLDPGGRRGAVITRRATRLARAVQSWTRRHSDGWFAATTAPARAAAHVGKLCEPRAAEARFRHADDRRRPPVHAHGSADDVRRAVKGVLPHMVTTLGQSDDGPRRPFAPQPAWPDRSP